MLNALKHSSDWILLNLPGLALTNAECTVKSAEPPSPVETLINLRRPLVIGHRGYNQIAPENTLPSFKLAKAAGADMVELDYYNAKDGKLVVIHDEVLDRTTDAEARWGEKGVPTKSKTSDELCSLNAGKWFDTKNAGSHARRRQRQSRWLDFGAQRISAGEICFGD